MRHSDKTTQLCVFLSACCSDFFIPVSLGRSVPAESLASCLYGHLGNHVLSDGSQSV